MKVRLRRRRLNQPLFLGVRRRSRAVRKSHDRVHGRDRRSYESFGRDDLLLLAKFTDLAHSRIFDLQELDRGFEKHG